jgi:GTP-binding protein
MVVLNKIDVPDGKDLAEMVRPDLEARGYRVFAVSAASHEGLAPLSFALAALVQQDRADRAAALQSPRIVIRPKPLDEQQFTVKVEQENGEPVYRVLGGKPERWVAQTDFANDEAVGYLADRLQKLGVEDALFEAGAQAGSTVVIGRGDGVVFDWEPTLSSAAELMVAPRGSDPRITGGPSRRTTHERREEYRERMDAKSAARADLDAERRAERAREEALREGGAQ